MTNPNLAPTPVQRLLSLDVLRGVTLAFMVMVNNNGGSGSWGFMNHAAWNGLTPTDLVFPTFVFVVGASVVFAFEARLARGATRMQLAGHTLERATALFLLGVVVNGFPFFGLNTVGWEKLGGVLIAPLLILLCGAAWIGWRLLAGSAEAKATAKSDAWRVAFLAFFVFILFDVQVTEQRIYGVLQRIAVAYLAVGLFYLWDKRAWTKAVALVVALVGYYALLRWAPVPGAGMPGRDFPFMDKSLNLVSWVDRLLMPHHLYLDWSGPELHNVRDPEGLLSDLPAIGTALLGMLAALWMRTQRTVKAKSLGLAAATVACLGAGYLWSIWFPLNKNLWTSSFVLVAAGYSLLVLTLAYWVVEQWGWGKGRKGKAIVYPWLVLGSNAIVAYMFSEVVPGLLSMVTFTAGGKRTDVLSWVVNHVFVHIPDPGWAAFAFSVFTLAYCFIPVWILYRNKIFVKV